MIVIGREAGTCVSNGILNTEAWRARQTKTSRRNRGSVGRVRYRVTAIVSSRSQSRCCNQRSRQPVPAIGPRRAEDLFYRTAV
jgi:hypothetical protein